VLFDRRGLGNQYDPNHPDERIAGNHPKLLEVGAQYVGVVRIDLRGDVAYLRRVAIDEPWQRMGYGRILIDRSEQFATELGALRVESDVALDAIDFYRKCGYQVTQPQFHGGSVAMRKPLRVA
jgi:GNAT superfamily N-acetyltransferase